MSSSHPLIKFLSLLVLVVVAYAGFYWVYSGDAFYSPANPEYFMSYEQQGVEGENIAPSDTSAQIVSEQYSEQESSEQVVAPVVDRKQPILSAVPDVASPVLASVRRDAVSIVGISRRVSLSQGFDKQITALWTDFYNLNLHDDLSDVENSNNPYMVYKDYESSTESVVLVLGLASTDTSNKRGVVVQGLPAGRYLKRDSVLSMWQNPGTLPLAYEMDYEVFTLDRNFEIKTQHAYLSFSN